MQNDIRWVDSERRWFDVSRHFQGENHHHHQWLSTSWSDEPAWQNQMAQIAEQLDKTKRVLGQHTTFVAADFSIELRDVEGEAKHATPRESTARHTKCIQGLVTVKAWTLRWKTPNRRPDGVLTSSNQA